jgi:hypothetical protein
MLSVYNSVNTSFEEADMIDYEQRKRDMEKLRFEDGWTLRKIADEIGKRYGTIISRERVRQIIGNTGNDFRKEWTRKLIRSGRVRFSHHSELKDAPGIRREWMAVWGQERHEARGGGFNAIGQRFEEKASTILAQNGISNKLMPYRHPYDIEVEGGVRIDVKRTTVNMLNAPSQKCASNTWSVPHLKSGEDCDFFFVFVPDDTYDDGWTYFVIPSFEVRKHARNTRIRIPHPNSGQKVSKWTKYHRRIDLIKFYTVKK